MAAKTVLSLCAALVAFVACQPAGPRVGANVVVATDAVGRTPSAQASLRTVEATVSIDPQAGTLAASAVVSIATHGARRARLQLATGGDEGDGLEIASVRLNGHPCPFTTEAGAVEIALPAVTAQAEVSLTYAGPVGGTGDFINSSEIMLRGEAGWLPMMTGSMPNYDVEITDAGGFELFGQGTRSAAGELDSNAAPARWQHHGDSFTVYGTRAYRTQVMRLGGTVVTIAARPDHATHLAAVGDQVERVLQGLSSLGSYPLPRLNVVEGGLADGHGGYGALSNISIGWRTFAVGGDLQFLAHEVAHGWFGGLVLAPPAAEPGAWSEALAEYVSGWALPDVQREALWDAWTHDVAALERARHVALRDVRWSDGWEVYGVVAYAKGALVLVGLERRIGRAAMGQLLRRFVDERAAKVSRWQDLVELVGEVHGEAHARWLTLELE